MTMTDIKELDEQIKKEFKALDNPKGVVPKKAREYITAHLKRIGELVKKVDFSDINPEEKTEAYRRLEAVRVETEHLDSLDIDAGVRKSLRVSYDKMRQEIENAYGSM
jgi:RNA-binding protein YlmH